MPILTGRLLDRPIRYELSVGRHRIGRETCNDLRLPDSSVSREHAEILELVNDEIQSRVCAKRGFREFERVFRFKLLSKRFEVGVELSAKQEIKRHVISTIYEKEIAALFAGK